MRILIVLCLLILSGCQLGGTLINAGHRLYAMVADDRTATDDWTDVRINAAVRDAMGQRSAALIVDVEVTVFEGSVLLTGIVPKGDVLNDILTATWSVPGVRKVYNYVRVGEAPEALTTAGEAALATKIKAQLGLTPGIDAPNYKLVLENGVVYLMGICAGEEEYGKVLAVLKNTDGIDKIINLTRQKM